MRGAAPFCQPGEVSVVYKWLNYAQVCTLRKQMYCSFAPRMSNTGDMTDFSSPPLVKCIQLLNSSGLE